MSYNFLKEKGHFIQQKQLRFEWDIIHCLSMSGQVEVTLAE